jgi:inner membrane protein
LRPLLPWDGRWFYGDLVFIIDPYLILVLGGAAFLLTSNRRWKTVIWSIIALVFTIILVRVPAQRTAGIGGLTVARIIWISGVTSLGLARLMGLQKRVGKPLALAALAFVLVYWGALAWAHHAAYNNAEVEANAIASQRSERFIRVAAMPTAANPLQWLCVAETDHAMYRFFVGVGDPPSAVAGSRVVPSPEIERYEKPTGKAEQLVSAAALDPRAEILLGFARFPIARVEADHCSGQALVQFADLRYTEPGVSRGNFSLTVPVNCPAP